MTRDRSRRVLAAAIGLASIGYLAMILLGAVDHSLPRCKPGDEPGPRIAGVIILWGCP